MAPPLYVLGFLLVLVLAAVLCYLRDLRLYGQECDDDLNEFKPVGDSGRRVLKVRKAPPMAVKALGVMQHGAGWGVLYSDGQIVGEHKTADEAREILRLENAKRP